MINTLEQITFYWNECNAAVNQVMRRVVRSDAPQMVRD